MNNETNMMLNILTLVCRDKGLFEHINTGHWMYYSLPVQLCHMPPAPCARFDWEWLTKAYSRIYYGSSQPIGSVTSAVAPHHCIVTVPRPITPIYSIPREQRHNSSDPCFVHFWLFRIDWIFWPVPGGHSSEASGLLQAWWYFQSWRFTFHMRHYLNWNWINSIYPFFIPQPRVSCSSCRQCLLNTKLCICPRWT